MKRVLIVIAGAVAFAGCGNDAGECKLGDPMACKDNQVCETYSDPGGMHTSCFAPTELKGKITNADTGAAVAGARVVAIDGDSHAAVGPVSLSDASGNYVVRVEAPRAANAKKQYTLRVAAAAFRDFPSGIRIALPITVAFADPKGAATVDGPQDVALEPIAMAPPGAIAGKVTGSTVAGVLVVAEAAGKGQSAVSDSSGEYVIFNVPDGSYTVSGYFVGVNFTPVANVAVAGGRKDGVDLVPKGAAAGALTGTLSYVAGADTSTVTSVVLRLKSTFEVPPGLSTPAGNANPYQLAGVPDGTYDVLAAYPTDGLVKDPDPGISGTPIPTVTINGAPVDAGAFKITDPVEIVGPDASAKVTGAPMLSWMAYPSADHYLVEVFDSQGNPVSMTDNVMGTSLPGPAGTPGRYYQWRITAFRKTGLKTIPTSVSEDLRGVWLQQ